jgi:hypothetical protein
MTGGKLFASPYFKSTIKNYTKLVMKNYNPFLISYSADQTEQRNLILDVILHRYLLKHCNKQQRNGFRLNIPYYASIIADNNLSQTKKIENHLYKYMNELDKNHPTN